VICSADTGQGAGGTEELLSALRRFAGLRIETSCRWPIPACAVSASAGWLMGHRRWQVTA